MEEEWKSCVSDIIFYVLTAKIDYRNCTNKCTNGAKTLYELIDVNTKQFIEKYENNKKELKNLFLLGNKKKTEEEYEDEFDIENEFMSTTNIVNAIHPDNIDDIWEKKIKKTIIKCLKSEENFNIKIKEKLTIKSSNDPAVLFEINDLNNIVVEYTIYK